MTDKFKEALADLQRLSKFAHSTDDNIPFHHTGTINMLTHRIERALTLATESEQLRDAYTSMGVTLAARNSEIEQLRKRLAELETLIDQANKKIQWYERTEAKNA